jgi:hypothetical protein
VGYAVNHRSLSDFGSNDRESIFTLVAVFGLRGKGRAIMAEYQRAEVPVLVVDFGYLRRRDHWQISLNGLNRIPEFACPADRFEALGPGYSLWPMKSCEGPTVLCGQLVGDMAHPFDTEKKLNAWLAEFPDLEYRAHPLVAGDTVEPVASLLNRAGKIVTWNSNIGNEAWLAGVPVEARAPDAMYGQVTPENRPEYFARLAYGQWTEAEMQDGSAARFVTEHVLTGAAPELPPDRPVLTVEIPPEPSPDPKLILRRSRR